MREVVQEVLDRLEACLQKKEIPSRDLHALVKRLVVEQQLTPAELDRMEDLVEKLATMTGEILINIGSSFN